MAAVFITALNHEGVFHLPELLTATYIDQLKATELFDKAVELSKKNKNMTGGEDEEDAVDHFTGRFGNSSSRLTFLICNKDGRFTDVNGRLTQVFSSGQVSLLDMPAGTGAAGLTLITAICKLRNLRLQPWEPLTVCIHAADLSEHALETYQSMVDRIREPAATYGVCVEFKSYKWDVLSISATASFMRSVIQDGTSGNEFIICISNFSDFAKNHTKEVMDSVKQCVGALAGLPLTFIWIEPRKKVNSLLHNINKFLDSLKYVFTNYMGSDGTGGEYSWRCPLSDCDVKSNMKLVAYRKYEGEGA